MTEATRRAPALRLGAGARMAHERPGRIHPLTHEAAAAQRGGRIGRRDFLRIAALLGLFPAAAPWRGRAAEAEAAAELPRPGGVLRCAMPVRAIDDPALFEWVEKSNLVRHQNEYLTLTGADNITRPMLARGWAASDDLTIWTLALRDDVRWHNGEPLTVDHVIWNFQRWIDPDLGASTRSLLAPLTGQGAGIERVDDWTLRLHLSKAMLSLPESLYNYPTAILHPSFEGDIVAQPLGTGPYRLAEVAPGERARLERVAEGDWRYWGGDAPTSGPGLLDTLEFLHVEPGAIEGVEMAARGEVDLVYEIGVDGVEPARAIEGARAMAVDTATTGCLRMRVDKPPFNSLLFRRALQRATEPAAFPAALFRGLGRAAEHHHVAPLHPDYFRLRPLQRDVQEARNLLSAAGFPDGADITLDVGNTSGPWQQQAAELFRDQAAEAGIRVHVNVVAAEEYHRIWTTTPFGLTQWAHRPLGTMALSLAYRGGAPWNETGYTDPAFDAALDRAEAHLDVLERRSAMEQVERILQDAAVIVQPVWTPVFALASGRLRGFELQPTQYLALNNAWLEA